MKCPGQDSRYWKPGAIFDVKCPSCGEMIEFFKDDTRRRCPGCGQEVPNPEMDFGCAAYCPYAEQCLGGLADVTGDGKLKILKGKMLKEIRQLYENKSKLVAQATTFLELCEDIGKKEGADLGTILLAGFVMLHLPLDPKVEQLKGIEKQMREKLTAIGADKTQTDDALNVIEEGLSGHLEAGKTMDNFNVIKDALAISTFEARGKTDWQSLSERLLTDSGRQLAQNKAALG